MSNYEELVNFLNGLDDFFIEVEGKHDKISRFIDQYNSETGAAINLNSEGICILEPNANKWGLEFRLYSHEKPKPLIGNEFHTNTEFRHRKYKYRCSNNGLVSSLLYDGFNLGRN